MFQTTKNFPDYGTCMLLMLVLFSSLQYNAKLHQLLIITLHCAHFSPTTSKPSALALSCVPSHCNKYSGTSLISNPG